MASGFDIEQYCLDNLVGARINGTKQAVGTCPWCGRASKFYVDVATGKYVCFSCEESGRNIAGLVSQVEGITRSEARRYVFRNQIQFRRKMGLDDVADSIAGLRAEKVVDEEKVTVEMPPENTPVYSDGKWRYPCYLKTRGIKKATAAEWKLGWARSGRYKNRLLIPIECPNGASFTARDMTGEAAQKYLNPTDVDQRKLLLGWYHAPLNGDLVIVEGPLDAIRLWQHGIPAVATLGKVLHSPQLDMLTKKPRDAAITVMYDPEEQTAPYKASNLLLSHFEQVYIARLPLGVDPGSSTKKQAVLAMKTAVQHTGDRTAVVMALIDRVKEA